MNNIILNTLSLILFAPLFLVSQTSNKYFENPSFEGEPKKGEFVRFEIKPLTILPWEDCGQIEFPGETAADVHGSDSRYWTVEQAASHGNTYLGMVVRDNNSWEAISQELNNPFLKDKCYQFTIDIAKTMNYISQSRLSNLSMSFNGETVLRIWGGLSVCDRSQLLYESSIILNTDWKTYDVEVSPTKDILFLTLEAYYADDKNRINGNVLVDNISEILIVDCEN